MEHRIAIIVPSRGRPVRLSTFIESVLNTTKHLNRVHVYVGLDSDDPTRPQYQSKYHAQIMSYHEFGLGPSVPKITNFLVTEQARNNDLFVLASDDVIIRTNNWDTMLDAFYSNYPDRLWLGYLNNGRNREKAEHLVISKEWITVTSGQLWYTEFEHFCSDAWLEDIAKRIVRLHFFKDIVFDHMHYKYNKALMDDTYRMKRYPSTDKNFKCMSERDNAKLVETVHLRIALAEKLNAAKCPF